jgi:hypothetical protein
VARPGGGRGGRPPLLDSPPVGDDHDATVDHLGARRLGTAEAWFWYLLAAVTYIGASLFNKFLLNWLIGPLWLVLVVWLGPTFTDRVAGRRR